MTATDLVTDVLIELGVARAGDVVAPDDAAFVLTKLNRLFDNWNADGAALYSVGFPAFTITPNLQPHTIGLAANTPTWTVTVNRPVKILGANLVLNTVTPNVNCPLNIVDDQWWLGQSVPTVTSTSPTDLFYKPDWPNGSVYLWPVPTTAYQIQLETRTLLAALALTDTFTLPPGYQDAITLTVAEEAAPAFGQPISPRTTVSAAKARARIFATNAPTPRLTTRDAGMPGGGGGATFNYLTRQL